MEPSGRKRWQTIEALTPRNRLRTARLFANSCHRSLPTPHGKEGVDGSSPSEGTSTTPMQTSTWCSLVGVPQAEKFRRQIEAG
jgi:hypothetical protein